MFQYDFKNQYLRFCRDTDRKLIRDDFILPKRVVYIFKFICMITNGHYFKRPSVHWRRRNAIRSNRRYETIFYALSISRYV